jgi:hypothetical protein
VRILGPRVNAIHVHFFDGLPGAALLAEIFDSASRWMKSRGCAEGLLSEDLAFVLKHPNRVYVDIHRGGRTYLAELLEMPTSDET